MTAPIGSEHPANAAVRVSGLANAALGTALFAYICFWGLGGFLALVLGFSAHAEISRSGGRLAGTRRASLAIALGALNLVATLFLAIRAVSAIERWTRATARPSPSFAHPAPPVPPATSSPSARPRSVNARSSVDSRTIVTSIGHITLVDPGRGAHPLREFLAAQRVEADRTRSKLLLFVTAPACAPCAGVAAALDDRSMQQALGGVRLVRLDVVQFGRELVDLELPAEKIPGFVLVGPDNRALDYIHGGEWDADIPANMAPVLNKFVRGTLTQRRDAWHGGPHPNGTPIGFFW